MDPAKAVLAALDEEGASGEGYQWPDRSCVSLIRALCRHGGTPEPSYAPWEALSEREAASRAVREYGSMGAGHQAGLAATGAWEAVEGHPRPGDVVSWRGRVETMNGEVYDPPAEGFEATGVCGVYGFRWMWTGKGLSTVVRGEVGYVTRMKPCR